jgi:hypothetical protein
MDSSPGTTPAATVDALAQWLADAVSEYDAHPGTRHLHLRNAVLEAPLRLATGHEEVPLTKSERARPPTSQRAEKESSWLTQ